jgi:hypothetical protein
VCALTSSPKPLSEATAVPVYQLGRAMSAAGFGRPRKFAPGGPRRRSRMSRWTSSAKVSLRVSCEGKQTRLSRS